MIVDLAHYDIRTLMERSYRLYAHLPALAFFDEKPFSYQQLQNNVREIATLLINLGVKEGDRVAILGDNSPNWVIAYLATTSLGMIAVPILPGFPDADIRHIIRHSEAIAAFISQKQRAKLEDLENAQLHTIISLEDWSIEEAHKQRTSLLARETQFVAVAAKEKPFPSHEVFDRYPAPEEGDLAVIIYTSGTTGNSKGVMLTHRNIVYDVVQSIERFPIHSDDRFLSILPLSHAYESTGGMLCPLAVGVSIYYLRGLPTPQKLLDAMSMVHPTGVLTVPLVVDKVFRKRIVPQIQSKRVINKLYQTAFFRKKLHQVAGKKLITSFGGQLRFFMFGGAALNPDTETFLRDSHISYSSGYGMTETSPIMTINPFGAVKMGSCGKSIPGITMRIHNPDPQTGIGEIIVQGDIVMQGYYKNDAATQETFLPDGWLKTGDLGYFDDEGYLFIKGRSKNVIVGPSGENIYPEIVEQEILQSPYIQEALVYDDKGKLTAKVYLDHDFIDQNVAREHLKAEDPAQRIEELLELVRQEVNARLPVFSRLITLIEHPEPFEKTPTNKIKRHLYLSGQNS